LGRENRFSAFSDDGDDDDSNEVDMEATTDPLPTTPATQTAPVKQIKPPLIFLIPDFSDIRGLITDVALAISNTKFDYKSGKESSVRINLFDKESFPKLKAYLNDNEVNYQTFQPEDERAYRI
ncbi:hypothetical protein AWZ03_015428, partial [Drosophila navojoa]